MHANDVIIILFPGMNAIIYFVAVARYLIAAATTHSISLKYTLQLLLILRCIDFIACLLSVHQ